MNTEEKKELDEAKKKAKEANDQRNEERLKIMDAIADKSEENRSETEALQVEDSDVLPEEKSEEVPVLEEPAREEESDTRITNGQTYYRQVVNGREVWQTLKEIRETAQKVTSADEYLRQAAEGARKASELDLSQDDPVSLGKDEVRKLLAAAALGDEEAIERLASFYTARPSVDMTDILQKVDQRLSFRTELARLEDKSADLLNDPWMGRLFRVRLNELKAENPNMGLKDAYSLIDKEIRQNFPGHKTGSREAKLERKRTLPPPINTGQRAGTQVEEEGEENLSEVIEKMAAARGLNPKVHRST